MGLYVFTYLCVAIFVVAAGRRIYKQLTLPVHLRWELYPVKHEAGEKAEYGGSYMEELNWWESERERSLLNEIKYMIPEILLLRGLWSENRKLWWVSFPFHCGLYLLICTLGLLLVSAVAMSFGANVATGSGGIGSLICYLTIMIGFLGLVLGTIGVLGLLARRLFDPQMRGYSTSADYFNLMLFLTLFTTALLTWATADRSLDGARTYVYGLVTLGHQPRNIVVSHTLLGELTIVLASLVTAYVPLTHMSHMFMKYFTYHQVMWEDAPNLRGSAIESAILQNLGFKPTWSASHIGADGKRTWAEIATSEPKEGK